jgi:hypothetical protein
VILPVYAALGYWPNFAATVNLGDKRCSIIESVSQGDFLDDMKGGMES